MPFFNASDDFRRRTLSSVDGILRQLAYVIRLRGRGGQYDHWGLSRTHGPEAAQDAIAANHSEAWMSLLRTPLPDLAEEIQAMSETERAALLKTFAGYSELTCPRSLSGGSIRHFNSIVLTLDLLSRAADVKTAA